ncbi:cell adhesion molecule Dscam1-like [Tachypleus tridentatus]|uniref:cell adhesion molecule Dscam1-like n=1 Tax=Tachypleus tridentatus TaxID=6853 RepID=UPI003FD1A8BF
MLVCITLCCLVWGELTSGLSSHDMFHSESFDHWTPVEQSLRFFWRHLCFTKRVNILRTVKENTLRHLDQEPTTEKYNYRWKIYSFVNKSLRAINKNGDFMFNSNDQKSKRRHVRHVVARNRRHTQDMRKDTAVQGKTAKLQCPNYEMSKEKVTWLKDGAVLPVSHRQTVEVDGTLILQDVSKKVDEGLYRCQYKVAIDQEVSHLIQLKIVEPPAVSEFHFSTDSEVGMRMKVICAASRGDPPFDFTWLKDSAQLTTSLGLSIQFFRDYSMLSTDNLQLKHSGNYTCQVTNQGGTASYSSLLKVNAPPSWSVEPQDTDVSEGGLVRIDCSAKGFPSPTIKWIKSSSADYIPIYNSHKYNIFSNGSLQIRRASDREKGFYICEAGNGIGTDLRKLIYLTVHHKPRFDIKFKSHAAKKGDRVVLSVTARGDLPIQFVWKKDGVKLENDTRYLLKTLESQSSSHESMLIIKHAVREDSGVYVCTATNDYGKDETRLQLLIQEAPGPPLNFTVTNISARTSSLTWTEPFSGNSAIIRYLITYYKIDDGEESSNVSVDGSITTTIISKLRPATLFRASIRAQNGFGWSNFSNFVEFTTSEEAPSGPPEAVKGVATGPNSVKVSWKPPEQKDWNGKIRGYYVGYRSIGADNLYQYKKIDITYLNTEEETHLTNLKRSTVYLVSVQAFNTEGVGPRSDEVEVKTLEDVPPTAPDVKVFSSTVSSVTLGWSQKVTFGKAVTDYVLHSRKNEDPWEETPIKTNKKQYTVTNLKCGSNYQFFFTAHNSVGKSEPSNVVHARTEGAAPLSPTHEEFVSIQQTQAVLHLSKWEDGGCPISSFTVRLREKFRNRWRTVADKIPANKPNFAISRLVPSTWYKVLVIARNSAGATEAIYDFKTHNLTRDVIIHEEATVTRSTSLITDLEILIPVIVSSFVVLVVLVVGCVLCFREQNTRNRTGGMPQRPTGKVLQDTVQLKELGSPPALDTMSSEEGTQRSSSQSQSTNHYPGGQTVYSPRPEEGHPYATPYDTLPVPPVGDSQQPSSSGIHTLNRRGLDKRINNIYYSRQEGFSNRLAP